MSNLKKIHDLSVEIEMVDEQIEDLNKIAKIIADSKKRGVGVGIRIEPDEKDMEALTKKAVGNIEVIKVDMSQGGIDMSKVLDKAMKAKEEFELEVDELNPKVSISIDESDAFLIVEVMMKNLESQRKSLVDEINKIKVK
jgi:hypothetical protein